MRVIETPHPPGAVVLITGELVRYASSLQHLSRLAVPNRSMEIWRTGVLVAENLNRALDSVMAVPEAAWVWLMGDDHTYADETVLRLLDRQVDVVATLCLNRVPPMDPFILSAEHGRMKHLEELPTSGLYKLGPGETCGDAGLLIRRNVLEALERPFYNRLRTGGFKADDQAFTRKIQDAGFPVYVDLDTRIGHLTPVAVEPVVHGGQWHVRLSAGHRQIVDVQAQREPA
jgi:hypothetical protein